MILDRYYLGLGSVASRVETTMDRLHRVLSDSYDDVWSLRRLQATTLADPDLADKLAEHQAAAADSAASLGRASGGGAGVAYGGDGGIASGGGRSGASNISRGGGSGRFGAHIGVAGGNSNTNESHQSSLHAAAVEALVNELRDVRIDDVAIGVPPRPRADRPWRTSLLSADVED